MAAKKNIFIGLGIAALAAVITWAVTTVPQSPPPTVEKSNSQVMTYDGNTISEEKNGKKIWELTAEHIEVDIKTQNATLTNLTGQFFAQDGRIVTLQADEGSFDNETKDIAIKGHVQITNSDGASLSSDELKWQSQAELLTAVGNAVIKKDDLQATGESITSSDGFNKIKIAGKAHLSKGETAHE